MNKETILQLTEKAVQAVEAALSNLDSLNAKTASIQSDIGNADADEQKILAGGGKAAVKSLLALRAERDLLVAELARTQAEVAAAELAAIECGIKASQWLDCIKDGIVEARKNRIVSELETVFHKDASLEVERLVHHSALDVLALNDIERLVWVRTRVELGLRNCRKIRALYDTLSEAVRSEGEINFIVAPSWLEPVAAPAVVEAGAGSNSLGVLV